jgi:hypothetical protein
VGTFDAGNPNINYSVDRFSEDGGKYIKEEGSERAGQQERAGKAEMYRKGMRREEAQKILLERIGKDRNTVLKNDSSGEEARLSIRSIHKMTSGAAVKKTVENGFTEELHHAVASDIEHLYKNALKVLEHSDRGNDTNIKAMHRFAAPLNIENAVAYITVKESTEHGRALYSVESIEIEKLAGMLKELYDASHLGSFPLARASLYKDNINKLRAAVNSQAKENKKSSGAATDDNFVDLGDAPEPAETDATGAPRPLSQP